MSPSTPRGAACLVSWTRKRASYFWLPWHRRAAHELIEGTFTFAGGATTGDAPCFGDGCGSYRVRMDEGALAPGSSGSGLIHAGRHGGGMMCLDVPVAGASIPVIAACRAHHRSQKRPAASTDLRRVVGVASMADEPYCAGSNAVFGATSRVGC